jgi:hypothetical protein
MTTPTSPTLAPAAAGVHSDSAPESRFGNPGLPLDGASRRAGATDDLGANPPDDDHSPQDLSCVKAGLQAATADLERLRGRLLNALNKGLVLYELGAILDRLEALGQALPDAPSDRPAPPTHAGEACARPAPGQGSERPV